MAFIRERKRNDGTPYYSVTYRVGGRGSRQSSTSFPDKAQADKFCALVDSLGVERALEVAGIADTPQRTMSALTVSEYLDRHITGLSGVERQTIGDYRRFAKNDIGPAFGAVPLGKLTRDDVAAWVNAMHAAGAANGTMLNKHGFLSGALKRAVEDGHLAANPCDGVRVPRTEVPEMVFLTGDEYRTLKAAFSEHYQPLIEFLVVSGCRAGEALALRPSDVNRNDNTVRIQRAWKRDEKAGGYYLGPPKTRKAVRTINVPPEVLDQLDYSREWLFTTTKGEAIKLGSWRANVWYKSLRRAQASGLTKAPRIHDLRHTCASWLIAQAVPLPVIQDHLGHESIKTTVDRYGHLDRTSHVAAAQAMSRMLG